MRRFFQALRPGAAEGFQYRSGDIVRSFARIGENIEGNDKIRASRIDVDQAFPDGRIIEDLLRDQGTKQVVG